MIVSAFLQKRIPTEQPTTVPFQTWKVWVWAMSLVFKHLSDACARITLESLAKLSSWRSWTQGLYIDDHWCTYCVPLSTLFGYVHFVLSCWNAQKKHKKSILFDTAYLWRLIAVMPKTFEACTGGDLKGASYASLVGSIQTWQTSQWRCGFVFLFLCFDSSDINALWISDVFFQQGKGVASERDTSVGSDPGTFLYFPTVSKLVK